MKKICALFCVLFLCAVTTLPVFAQADVDRMVDLADLVSEANEQTLREQLNTISESQSCDVVIVTVNSMEGETATAYADDFFDYNGYGYGQDRDGILFLISMEDRDWAISTRGYAISAFTDAGQEYMMEQILPDLSDGDYASAFTTFANQCNAFLSESRSDEAYDVNHMPTESESPTDLSVVVMISLLIGIAVGAIVVLCLRSQLKTVGMQAAADSYVRAGSMRVTGSRDTFLFRNVTRTARPKDSDGGGGSSTHFSSSGASHGGSSGKF